MPIVEAVGLAVGSNSGDESLARAIEAAMTQAIVDAQAEGITDPDEIRTRMMAARAQVLDAQVEPG